MKGAGMMKSYRKELWFHVPARRGLVNITPQVEEALRESGIKEGLVLVNAMNITASVFINDDEAGLHHDYEVWLEKLAPEKPYDQYHHNGFEDNADAHLKRTIMGREVVVQPNPRVHKALKTQMAAILAELERIAAGDSVPDELLSTIDLIAITMQGLKGEDAND